MDAACPEAFGERDKKSPFLSLSTSLDIPIPIPDSISIATSAPRSFDLVPVWWPDDLSLPWCSDTHPDLDFQL